MTARWGLLAALAVASGFCADWNPKLAADYLDARQKAWFAWPTANKGGTTCLSCHTNLTYAFARPALRRALHEQAPTAYETGMLANIKARLDKWPVTDPKELAAPSLGVESVLATVLLTAADSGKDAPSKDTEKAFDRMWLLQLTSGKSAGAWNWFNLGLDPWEMPESPFFGATMAAMAVGTAPGGYASRPAIAEHLAALKTYLKTQQASQPLHNRLMLVWASTKLDGLLTRAEQHEILSELAGKQQPDGGWTMESLGAFAAHPSAPPASGSNSYATALVTFVAQAAGADRQNAALVKARHWLESHQDRESGFWDAQSMNKHYEAGSIPLGFMRDAATSFAVLALLDAGKTEAGVQTAP